MSDYALPAGCIPIVCTPFDDAGSVDHSSLRREVTWLVEQGAAGVAALALASEGYKLSDSERDEVLATVVDETAGRVSVIASVDATGTSPAVDRAKRAADLGAAGLMTMPPSFVTPAPSQIVSYYQHVGAATELPIILQDAPQITGVGTGPDIWRQVADTVPTLAALKLEAVPQGPPTSIASTIAPDRLRIYSGWGGISILDVLERGAHGSMPAPSFTPLFVAIHRAWDAGDRVTATRLLNEALPFLVWSMQTLDHSVMTSKQAFQRQGLFSTAFQREPVIDFDDITMAQLERFLGSGTDSTPA